MYFCRFLKPFYAITFDLDNTIYDNNLIITRAEEKSVGFLQQYHPMLSNIKNETYFCTRQMLRIIDPEIYHDVSYWRWQAMETTLLKAGLSKCEAQLGADNAMELIMYWRNQINVSFIIHTILSALSARWPLIAITNGNANLISSGLQKYFHDILRAGINGRAKPHTDMYYLASKLFGISCKYILHVGDDLETDIQGSMRAGMQSCWIRQYYLNKNYIISDRKLFPDLIISKLQSLTYLL